MDDKPLKVTPPKPRAKHVHEVLARCKGGPMRSSERPSRQHQKRELRHLLADMS